MLALLAAATAVAGLRTLPRSTRSYARGSLWLSLPAYALLAVTAAFAVPFARLLTVKPLTDFDAWAIWVMRARALYDFGHPIAPVFTTAPYAALQHPLFLPALDALDFRAMGQFDPTLVHLQMLGFGIAFVGGGWTLLREHASPLMLAATLLAVVTAPTFVIQLQTNYADVPLAVFVAVGTAALALWLRRDAPGLLPAATLFLSAAVLMKNEGEMFALAAFIAAALVAQRSQRRSLGLAALVVVAVDLPWRIWIWAHNVKIAEYSIGNLFSPSYLYDHRDRVGPSARELWSQFSRLEAWSYLVPLIVLGLAGALALRRVRPVLFGVVWLLLSFAGLLAIYWISTNPISSHLFNSSDRTVDSMVIGGALLVPVLLSTE